jgi:hypothetical protein
MALWTVPRQPLLRKRRPSARNALNMITAAAQLLGCLDGTKADIRLYDPPLFRGGLTMGLAGHRQSFAAQ